MYTIQASLPSSQPPFVFLTLCFVKVGTSGTCVSCAEFKWSRSHTHPVETGKIPAASFPNLVDSQKPKEWRLLQAHINAYCFGITRSAVIWLQCFGADILCWDAHIYFVLIPLTFFRALPLTFECSLIFELPLESHGLVIKIFLVNLDV